MGGTHFPGASQSADTANWTQECTSQTCILNSKCNKCCNWTCCSNLPIWQALYQPGMVLLPRWTTLWTSLLNQLPKLIYNTTVNKSIIMNNCEPWWIVTIKQWQNITTHHEPWRNIMTHHDTSRTMTKHHDTSRHIMNNDETSQHITNHDETSRHITTHHKPWRNITTHHKPWWNIMTHHKPWRNITTHHDTSQNIMTHHDTSQTMTKHHDTSWHVMNHDKTSHVPSRHITTHHGTSREPSWNILIKLLQCEHVWGKNGLGMGVCVCVWEYESVWVHGWKGLGHGCM